MAEDQKNLPQATLPPRSDDELSEIQKRMLDPDFKKHVPVNLGTKQIRDLSTASSQSSDSTSTDTDNIRRKLGNYRPVSTIQTDEVPAIQPTIATQSNKRSGLSGLLARFINRSETTEVVQEKPVIREARRLGGSYTPKT